LRFSTELTEQVIKQRVHALLDKHGLKYDCQWRLSGQPFVTEGGRLIAAAHQAIATVTGLSPQNDTGGGTSDGRFIAPTGAEVIELGPLNASIHKVNEHVAARDLETLTAIYQRILVNLLAS
jgi:succinyl-diaminopimelate desuccinylase